MNPPSSPPIAVEPVVLTPGDWIGILDAVSFAAVAHHEVGQLREGTNEPYIVHPIEVVKLLVSIGADPELIRAGATHDVDEDTRYGLAAIASRVGAGAAGLVSEVTNPDKPEGLSRAERKAIDRLHTAQASPRGQTLKAADIAANIGTGASNVARKRPKFAEIYLPEKFEMLQTLDLADRRLWQLAMERVQEGMTVLAELGVAPKSKPSAKP